MMRTSVNNYILRVYRLDRNKPQSLVGLVEEVGVKNKKAFTNLQELWEIVSRPGREKKTKR